uniref:Uncharacterized protein n=1 Tax=Cacopsylla melanoneura TaxID=428564 RepID=A0A8D8Z5W5_9HEMI
MPGKIQFESERDHHHHHHLLYICRQYYAKTVGRYSSNITTGSEQNLMTIELTPDDTFSTIVPTLFICLNRTFLLFLTVNLSFTIGNLLKCHYYLTKGNYCWFRTTPY